MDIPSHSDSVKSHLQSQYHVLYQIANFYPIPFQLHATAPFQSPSGSGPIPGLGVESEEKVPPDRTGWQLAVRVRLLKPLIASHRFEHP